MATWEDVRRIALALPETEETGKGLGPKWTVKGKPFALDRPLRTSDFEALGDAAPGGPVLAARHLAERP
jgi:hypothetical protein